MLSLLKTRTKKRTEYIYLGSSMGKLMPGSGDFSGPPILPHHTHYTSVTYPASMGARGKNMELHSHTSASYQYFAFYSKTTLSIAYLFLSSASIDASALLSLT